MPIANLDQHHIYYEEQGSGEHLVLIAGFTADHTVWSQMVDQLSQFYHVVVFDNPGVGRSSIPDKDYSLQEMAKAIILLLDYLNIQHANFIGHSMGAALLMQLCIAHSKRVTKALLCGGPAAVPITAKLQIQGLLYAVERKFPNEYISLSVMPWLYGRRFLNDKKRLEKLSVLLSENKYPQTLAGFLAQSNVVLRYDILSHLKKIKTECLIVASDEDLLIPMHCLHFLEKNISNSRLKMIGHGVGHMFHVEEPDQVVKLALNFF